MSFAEAYDPFRAIASAWRILTRAPLPILLGGFLLVITGGVRMGGSRVLEIHDLDFGAVAALHTLLCFGCCVGLALFLANCWLTIGFANSVEEVARTGRGDVATLFDPKGRFVAMLLARVLVFLAQLAAALPFVALGGGAAFSIEELGWPDELVGIGTAAAMLLYLPVFLYIVLGLAFVVPAVALEGREPAEALRRSWDLARGHRLRLFVYLLVIVVFTLLGLCLCCVGVFGTATLAHAAQFESYLSWTRAAERAGWWIERGDPLAAPV